MALHSKASFDRSARLLSDSDWRTAGVIYWHACGSRCSHLSRSFRIGSDSSHLCAVHYSVYECLCGWCTAIESRIELLWPATLIDQVGVIDDWPDRSEMRWAPIVQSKCLCAKIFSRSLVISRVPLTPRRIACQVQCNSRVEVPSFFCVICRLICYLNIVWRVLSLTLCPVQTSFTVIYSISGAARASLIVFVCNAWAHPITDRFTQISSKSLRV